MKATSKKAASKTVKAATKPGPVLNPVADASAASALRAIEAAEGQAVAATCDVFRACAVGATVTVAMIAANWPSCGESSRGVYASEFATAGKVAGIIGTPAALTLIDEAAKLPGRCKVNVLSALRDVRSAAGSLAGKPATKAQAAKLVTAAVKVAKVNGAAVKVKAKTAEAKRAPQVPAAAPASLKGAQTVMGPQSLLAALQIIITNGRTMKVDPSRQKLWDEGVKGLEVGFESLAIATKPAK